MRVFTINPGSTSTKVALFEDATCIFQKNVSHDAEKLSQVDSIAAQLPYRKETILGLLKEENISLDGLDAVVGRGGVRLPMAGGPYDIVSCFLDMP